MQSLMNMFHNSWCSLINRPLICEFVIVSHYWQLCVNYARKKFSTGSDKFSIDLPTNQNTTTNTIRTIVVQSDSQTIVGNFPIFSPCSLNSSSNWCWFFEFGKFSPQKSIFKVFFQGIRLQSIFSRKRLKCV